MTPEPGLSQRVGVPRQGVRVGGPETPLAESPREVEDAHAHRLDASKYLPIRSERDRSFKPPIVVGDRQPRQVTARCLASTARAVRLIERVVVLGGRVRRTRHEGYAIRLVPQAIYTSGATPLGLGDLGVPSGDRLGPTGVTLFRWKTSQHTYLGDNTDTYPGASR